MRMLSPTGLRGKRRISGSSSMTVQPLNPCAGAGQQGGFGGSWEEGRQTEAAR